MELARRVMAGFRGRARPRSGPSNGDWAEPWPALGTRRLAAGDWPPSEREGFPGIGLCTKPAGGERSTSAVSSISARPKNKQQHSAALLMLACCTHAKKALRSKLHGKEPTGYPPSGRLRTVSVGWRLSTPRSSSRTSGLDCEGRRASIGEASLGEPRSGRGEASMAAAELAADGRRRDCQ